MEFTNKIICQVNLFDLEQNIYFMSGATGQVGMLGTSTIPELRNNLMKFVKEKHAQQIDLFGEEQFLNQLVTKIKNEQTQNYGMNVRISLNGKVCN